jgi:dTDP-4-dehydrorhamnose 3,5-epimerase
MQVTETTLPGVLLIEPKVFGDARGFFKETWASDRYRQAGIVGEFVQDNLSRSAHGILRGMHLQHPHGQGKLVSVVDGSVFDVAIDVRVGSPTFGRWYGCDLSAENHRQLWIPPGFAHGFCVTTESAVFMYKCTDTYHPESEIGIAWNDPDVGIVWPISRPLLSAKDSAHPRLMSIAPATLPQFKG